MQYRKQNNIDPLYIKISSPIYFDAVIIPFPYSVTIVALEAL